MRTKQKTINCLIGVILGFCILFMSSPQALASANFTSYTSSNGTTYTYDKKPLGCNYTSKAQINLCNDGKDWAMSTTVTSYDMPSGALQINGTTTLSDFNLLSGFTGGTFIIAKDSCGFAICILNAKMNSILDQAFATNEDAEVYGWGVNPGKLSFYRWKPYIKPYVRTCSWQAVIPSYIMNFNPTITIVQCHTPSNRALRELNDIAKYALSFVEMNGINIAVLVIKAQSNTLTFNDIAMFSENVVTWAQIEKLITSEQANAVINIIAAIDSLVGPWQIGSVSTNYADMINLAYSIEQLVNNGSIANVQNMLSSLENLIENHQSSDIEQIGIILSNLKVLLNNKLNTSQKASFDRAITIIGTIDNLPISIVLKHSDIVFSAISISLKLYTSSSNGTLTASVVESNLTPLFIKIGTAIKSEYGSASQASLYYDGLKEIWDNVFIIIKNGNNGWSSDNLTTVVNSFYILITAIENKELSSTALAQFSNGLLTILDNNNGWSFENAQALANIIDGLNAFVYNSTLIQLKKDIEQLAK